MVHSDRSDQNSSTRQGLEMEPYSLLYMTVQKLLCGLDWL